MSRMAKERRQRRARKLYIFFGMVILMGLLSMQMLNLYHKKVQYEALEAAQEEELQAQMDRSEELKQYEEYTKSRDYIEDTAQSKLGLLYENEIIFREK